MRHIEIHYTLLLILILSVSGHTQYLDNWVHSNLIDPTSDVTRSLVYNPATDHILVATRKYGADIIILDAADGDSVGVLAAVDFVGGTLPLNMVAVSADGVVYASNLVDQNFSPGEPFKVYRYANESAQPEVVFESTADLGRYGDALGIAGSGNEIFLYASGQGNDNILVLLDNGGSELQLWDYAPLPQSGNARHGIYPNSPDGHIWINGADSGSPPPRYITNSGIVIATVPDSLASAGGTSTIIETILGDYSLIQVANSNSGSATFRSVRYFEDEIGTVFFDYFGEDSDSTALFYEGGNSIVPNTNATAALAYDSKRHSIVALIGMNAIGSFSMEPLLKTSTPRAGELDIQIDGNNDFFPTDRIGTSFNNQAYLTWSAEHLYSAINGGAVVDQYVYFAMDLNPGSDSGAAEIDLQTDAISTLPFLADFVIELDPLNTSGYVAGTSYRWDGSSWISSSFTGETPADGILSYAEDDFLEWSLKSSLNNLGVELSDISLMSALVNAGSSHEVTAAFPDINPTGSNVDFTHYFYADTLGDGYFPTDTMYVQVQQSPFVGIDDRDRTNVSTFTLAQNYPNPFNPSTTIHLQLATRAEISLNVFDVNGRRVRGLLSGMLDPGEHSIAWDGKDQRGHNVASGVYFYQVRYIPPKSPLRPSTSSGSRVAGRNVQTRKMLLIR